MAEAARPIIESDDSAPFFLYYASSDPHRGAGFATDLPHAPDRFGNRTAGYSEVVPVEYDPASVIVPEFLPDTPIVRAEIAQYYQAISRVDQGVGRLLEILESSGQLENTLIIYTSDHGVAFPGAKTTVYEPGLLVPLIVRHPDSPGGLQSDALTSMVDITPTILDFAGVNAPVYEQHIGLEPLREVLPETGSLHGRSFLDLATGNDSSEWDEVFASHTFHEIQMYYPMRSVRDRKFKLIWNIAYQLPFPFAADLWESPSWQDVYSQGPEALFGPRSVAEYIQRPEFELYDMTKDPFESSNLAQDPAYADVLERYKQKLKSHQKRTWDPWFLKWQYE